MTRTSRYSPEVRERAVRMVLEQEREYSSQWPACSRQVSDRLDCREDWLHCGNATEVGASDRDRHGSTWRSNER
jgi:hypothetical protein